MTTMTNEKSISRKKNFEIDFTEDKNKNDNN